MTDPIDPSNNVGKQTWNFNLVQDQLHVTWQCLLVRFKELYEKVSIGENLLRRRNLAEKAHELKTKRQSQSEKSKKLASPKETKQENVLLDSKIVTLPTTQIFDYMQAEPIEMPSSSATSPSQSQEGKFTPSNPMVLDQVSV